MSRQTPRSCGARRRWSRLALVPFLPVLAFGPAACAGDTASAAAVAVRDILPNGAERVRYGPLPVSEPEPATWDLQIGVLDGDPRFVLGDVRGIEVGEGGAVYVLDGQAMEIRVFGSDGSFQGILARRGEGPGEISGANGLVRALDGTFWVQDPGRWQLLRLRPEGGELERAPMPVRQFGYLWDGTVDDSGRIWAAVNHRDGSFTPPEPGLSESSSHLYLRSWDPRTGADDSVYVATRSQRGWVVSLEGGWSFRQIPYEPTLVTAVDPTGGVWAATTDRYRISRLDGRGDTVRVIEVDVPPEPVTSEDHARFLEAGELRGQDEERIARQILRIVRDHKPVLAGLVVDDVGNLWVRRWEEGADPPLFDVFDRSGEYLGSMRLGFRTPAFFPPLVRDGHLYTRALDDLDVQSVVRVAVDLR